MSEPDYISGLDPLPGGEMPRRAENPCNQIRNKSQMDDHLEDLKAQHDAIARVAREQVIREVAALLRSEDAVRRIGRASSECVAMLVERRFDPGTDDDDPAGYYISQSTSDDG